MWQAQVFTLYPDIFPGPLSKGLYGKAMSKNIWNLKVVNIRDAAEDKHKTVDDTPYGGGSGMLMKPDVLAKSLDQNKNEGEKILYLSPRGKKFDQNYAKELSKEKSISIICGHFEGVDERVLSTRNIEEVSIGDFILSGGESAAFVVIDSILRLLPGVLGNENSTINESFENGLLEYIFPEIHIMYGLDQTSEWHHKDIFFHTMEVVDNAAKLSKKVDLRLAALVHDIGKPKTRRLHKEKGYTFYGHDDVGARMLKGISSHNILKAFVLQKKAEI